MTQNKKQRLLKKYQNLFNLNEWNIKIEDLFSTEYMGTTDYNYFGKIAIISIQNFLTEEEYERTLLHEVLHIVMAPIDNYCLNKCKDKELISQIIEHIVIRLEKGWQNK